MNRATTLLPFAVVLVLGIVLGGCAAFEGIDLDRARTAIGISTLPESDTTRAIAAAAGTLENVINAGTSPFSPEQEYYVGRSVAATVLAEYEVYQNRAATDYVNRLGQALALASDRPQIYRGYSFLILDRDEINAFASPGGHIFVTRGMVRLTRSEDELAAVLAHEVAHVVHRHGLGSIKSARVADAIKSGVFEVLEEIGDEELLEVTEIFGDTTGEVFDTLASRGYSGPSEREADGTAVAILARVGYDPWAIVRVLERMDAAQQAEYEGDSEPRGFSKTHPRPQSRIFDLEQTDLRDLDQGSRIDAAAAQRRFNAAVAGI